MPGSRLLPEVNSHVLCTICNGYLVDATTIIECLHSFCRTCIVNYLHNSNYCPVCEVQVHKSRPLLSIRSDQTLQELVYKLVPGLYQNEMQKRREFYKEHPEAAVGRSAEERGESDRRFLSLNEAISITLFHHRPDKKSLDDNHTAEKDPSTRYLSCPAAFTVGHLKKFLTFKFSIPPSCMIDMYYDDHLLSDDFTLLDVAYIYSWKRDAPMTFSYSVSKRPPKPVCPPPPPQVPELSSKLEESTCQSENAVDAVIPEQDCDKASDQNKLDFKSEKMDVEVSQNVTQEPVKAETATTSEKERLKNAFVFPQTIHVKKTNTATPIQSTAKSNSSHPMKLVPLPIAEPTYNSVKLVSSPENNNLLSPTNGLRLKFIHDPELNPKSQKLKKSERKRGRNSRHKNVPVKLARLAPYPPLPVPATCLTTQSLQHIPQITVGKLVPTVITTLDPTIVTSLVSTSSTFCNASMESNTSQIQSFVSHPITTNISSVSTNFVSSNSNLIQNTITSSNTVTCSSYQIASLNITPQQNSNNEPSTCTKESNSELNVPPTTSPPISVSLPSTVNSESKTDIAITLSSPQSTSIIIPASSLATTKNSQEVPSANNLPVSCNSSAVPNKPDVIPVLNEQTGAETLADSSKSEEPSIITIDTNTLVKQNEENKDVPKKDNVRDIGVDKKSESFKLSVRNSISAEFSDNEDLGCQPDLVVDERKTDSSDNEEDPDSVLRKKITAIAEKDDEIDVIDVTDDTEADSGVSCAARSEDDADSVKTTESSSSVVSAAAAASVIAPPTTNNSTDDNHRQVKSNNINDVIKNLYRQHEISRPSSALTPQPKPDPPVEHTTKEDTGVLDLSTCTRKPGEVLSTRSRPVANPVLDIKHRQQAYLPAPVKQHTACAPAPKHNSSPLLLHHLTGSNNNSSILHAQLTGSPKSPHHPSSFSVSNSFPISPRPVSTPSMISGRATPNTYGHKYSPSASHAGNINLLPVIPFSATMMSLANFKNRSNLSVNMPLPNRTLPNNVIPKEVTFTTSNVLSFTKQTPTYSRKSLDAITLTNSSNGRFAGLTTSPGTVSAHSRSSSNSPNGRISGMPSSSATPTHPKTLPSVMRLSPHHRSASPAPSPQAHMMPTNSHAAATVSSSQSKITIPIYSKKQDSFKSYGNKFKGSNLAVFNPDPNGFRQKLVIKKLDSKPSSNSTTKNHS